MGDEQPKIASDALMREVAAKSVFNLPDGQQWIMVEENKCYRVFSEWRERIRARSAWQTPLGIALSLAVALAGTDIVDRTWIAKGTLKGFFLFCLLSSVAWFIVELVRALRSKDASVDTFITDLKKGTIPHDSKQSETGASA